MGELLNSTPSYSAGNGWRYAADRGSAYRVLCGGEVRDSAAFPAGSVLTFQLCFFRPQDADGETGFPDAVKLYIGDGSRPILAVPALRRDGTDPGLSGDPRPHAVFSADVPAEGFCPEGRGLFRYHWEADTPTGRLFTAENDGRFFLADRFCNEIQLMVYRRDYDPPEWLKNGVFYQIFVDRFFKSGRSGRREDAKYNDDWDGGIPEYPSSAGKPFPNNTHFGGDLYGIVEKLDDLKELGATCLYLSPIGEAFSNHKYDTGDYLRVDPSFGGDDAFRLLCEEAHRRNIAILLDGVFNHVGDDSVYFNRRGRYDSIGAYQSPDSPYASWFSFGKTRDEYDSWWGMKNLPKTVKNESFVSFICGKVIPKYMEMGADGYRLDVVDELDRNFVERICASVKEKKKDAAVIGEVWEDASCKEAYGERKEYFQGAQLDGVMNYPFRNGLIRFLKEKDPELLRRVSETLVRHYPPECLAYCMNFLGTHDTERILTVLGGDPDDGIPNEVLAEKRMTEEQRSEALVLLKNGYALLAALPGVPCIYYGDERGMEGYHDPFNRRPYPWKHPEPELTGWISRVNRVRKSERVFSAEGFRVLECKFGFFAFERRSQPAGDRLIAVCNLTGHEERISVPEGAEELLTGCVCGQETLIPGMTSAYYLIRGEKNND